MTVPVNLNMKLLVRFLFSLILIHPAITFSENKYSGYFQIKYGAVDFHKTATSIFNDDEAPNYKLNIKKAPIKEPLISKLMMSYSHMGRPHTTIGAV